MQVLQTIGVKTLNETNMKCKAVHKDLIFYLDGALPVEKMQQVSRHLDECADCREFLVFLKESTDIILEERSAAVSPYFFTRLNARIGMQQNARNNNWLVQAVQPAFFTVLLIAGIYAGLKIGGMASADNKTPEPSSGMTQIVNDFQSEPIESYLLDQL